MSIITKSDRDKIGNAIVYIAAKTSKLSKTKLLKLLYFMEELSVKKFYTPFLGLQFEVWQAGPVAKDVFIDLSETPIILDGFIKKEVINNATYIKAIKSFCDDEFSDNDIKVMDEILNMYANKTAAELVQITHEKDTLWYNVANKNGLTDVFESKLMNNSDYTIDFSELLSDSLKQFYKEQLDFVKLTRCYS